MEKQIRIVGLGPGPAEQLTRAAWEVLTHAGVLVLRTLPKNELGTDLQPA